MKRQAVVAGRGSWLAKSNDRSTWRRERASEPNKLVVPPKRDPRACSANACGNYAPVPHLRLSALCENLSSTRYAVFWCRVASTKEDCLVMIGANLSADIGLACGA